ncbi:hypothetical protein B0H65DRAFT_547616 [Neurospora tetraspora]|uniref:Uncharacterized protein n=1 Tax=Neurospora tetraspora TaxID=94610 RepID=A0AAE0JH54_9PEZI|nr:hypothetical protein B0H65DRAFT_547616 [Neurospora tetraspora]
MSNENHPPRVRRVTPIYSTLSYAEIVKKGLLADHQPQIPKENDKSGSHAEHTVTMPTENGKSPLSYADTLKTGLPAPKTSDQNNRPRSAGECSSTVSSNEDTQTTHTTQGTSSSRSTVAPNSGTSTDSSDQPLAASRSTQPVMFLRSVAANCGCLYIAETGISGHPSRDDLLESGFPVRGRCPKCNVLVTEIRGGGGHGD